MVVHECGKPLAKTSNAERTVCAAYNLPRISGADPEETFAATTIEAGIRPIRSLGGGRRQRLQDAEKRPVERPRFEIQKLPCR
jgi:hypothetical protein